MTKTALVTGASSGLGKAIYTWLQGEGWNAIGVSRRGPDRRVDLSSYEERENLLDSIEEDIDILVNNAGILVLDESFFYTTLLLDQKPLLYLECMKMAQVNLVSVWHLIVGLHSRGRFSEGSLIINIASVSGIKGEEDLPLYGALKAGVIGLTKGFAKSLIKDGIRVNCISPGFFDTNLVGETPEWLIDTIPMKRVADPKELIPVVRMLMDSPYMTGSNIVIDGGASWVK